MRLIDDITNFIFVEDIPQKSDAIFIPGGSHPQLGEIAADLFKQGYAPIVIPSGGVGVKSGKFDGVKSKQEIYNGTYSTDWSFLCDVLLKCGVPLNSILREDKSSYTKENALFSKKVVDKNNLIINKAIICCKTFHARRTLMFYQLAFPKTKFYIVPVDCYGINRYNWYKQNYGIERVMGELARCGNQITVDDIKSYL